VVSPGSIPHVRRVLPSLTLPNTVGFLRELRFPPVETLEQCEIVLTGPLERTV
jgi:hypothetical protein